MVFLTFVREIKNPIRYEEEKVSVPAIRQRLFGGVFEDLLQESRELAVWGVNSEGGT